MDEILSKDKKNSNKTLEERQEEAFGKSKKSYDS